MEKNTENQVVLHYLNRIINSGFFASVDRRIRGQFGAWLSAHSELRPELGDLSWLKDEACPVDRIRNRRTALTFDKSPNGNGFFFEDGASEDCGDAPARHADIREAASGQDTDAEVRMPDSEKPDAGKTGTDSAQTERKEVPMPDLEAVGKACEVFGIPAENQPLFELCYCLVYCPTLAELFQEIGGHPMDGNGDLFAAALNVSVNQLQKMGTSANPVIQKGLVVRLDRRKCSFQLAEGIRPFLALVGESASPEELRKAYFGQPLEPNYKAKDFFFCKNFEHALELLKSALAHKSKGVNILVYGPSGTGKTELVKTLCHEAGAVLYKIPLGVESEGECSRSSSALRASAILGHLDNTVLLVEGAGSLAGSDSPRLFRDSLDGGRLLALRELMENAPVPIIWIDTNANWIQEAAGVSRYRQDSPCSIISYFSLALQVKPLSLSQVPEAIKGIAEREQIEIGDTDMELLCKKAKGGRMTPGMIHRALETFKVTGSSLLAAENMSSFRKIMGSGNDFRRFRSPRLMGSNPRSGKKTDQLEEGFNPKDFSVDLVNATPSLVKLADRLADPKCTKRFSLCLFGVPGSGKSAYARYLADRLGMKVLQKRTSDILACWLGATERKIADAFKEARARNMILVFDEADSLLRDRRYAIRSWEVTQVNEMLTQMETHSLPFICTTNLMSDIDQASLRRFTFKVRYDFMTQTQVALAFQHFFNRPIEGDYSDLTELSPGDFATVKRKAEALGLDSTEELLEMLHEEQEIKSGPDRSRIGFNS